MIREFNECCSYAVPPYPCIGDSCPNRHVRRLFCDECKEEFNKLYVVDGDELCEYHALQRLEVIE